MTGDQPVIGGLPQRIVSIDRFHDHVTLPFLAAGRRKLECLGFLTRRCICALVNTTTENDFDIQPGGTQTHL